MKIQQLWADWSTEPENMIKPGNTWKDWGCARTADNIAVFLVESVEYLCSLMMDLWHAEPTRRAAWRITSPTQPAWIAGHESMYDYNCNQITRRRWLISILMYKFTKFCGVRFNGPLRQLSGNTKEMSSSSAAWEGPNATVWWSKAACFPSKQIETAISLREIHQGTHPISEHFFCQNSLIFHVTSFFFCKDFLWIPCWVGKRKTTWFSF